MSIRTSSSSGADRFITSRVNRRLPAALARILALALVAGAFTGCGFVGSAPTLVPAEQQQFATDVFADLRQRRYAGIESMLNPETTPTPAVPVLEQMSAAFPEETPKDIRVIGATTVMVNDERTINLMLEYQFSQTYVVAAMVFRENAGVRAIDGMRVSRSPQSQQSINAFTFAGRGLKHYAMLAACIAVPLLIVGSLAILYRTPIPRLKWLWTLAIATGLGQISMNWTTGAVEVVPLQFLLFGAGFVRLGVGPVMLAVALPIGAVVFLVLRARGRFASSAQQADTAR